MDHRCPTLSAKMKSMYHLATEAWNWRGLPGGPTAPEVILLAKLIKLALMAGFMALMWREFRGLL